MQESFHPIYAVGFTAVMMALSAWENLLLDTFTVVFVDNTAAQSALVAGKLSIECGRRILQHVIDEHRTAIRPWFGWVPLTQTLLLNPQWECMSTWSARGLSERTSALLEIAWLRKTSGVKSGRILTSCSRCGNLELGEQACVWGA